MNREGTLGTAGFLAIAAVVGVTLQTGTKAPESRTDRSAQSKPAKPLITKHDSHKKPGCAGRQEVLKDFQVAGLIPPPQCFESGDVSRGRLPGGVSEITSKLKFVIALMPDPVHTHSSALFDQFATAIQEGAQDEGYDFDSSWLPWDDAQSLAKGTDSWPYTAAA